jgi:hypothetical protein
MTTIWSRHSRRIEPISRSANAFCQGLCGDDLFDPQRLNSATKLVAIDSVTVADQIWFGVPFGEGFDQLLRGPFGARMFRDSEMKVASFVDAPARETQTEPAGG